jgi:hypothetical protein
MAFAVSDAMEVMGINTIEDLKGRIRSSVYMGHENRGFGFKK